MSRAANPPSRPVIIVITDDAAEDNYLVHNKREALERLMETAASLYGLNSDGIATAANRGRRPYLRCAGPQKSH